MVMTSASCSKSSSPPKKESPPISGKTNVVLVYSDSWKYFENLDRQQGTAPREVQEKGINENGAATNKLAQQGAEAAKMEVYLREWEAAHPKTEAIRPEGGLSKEAIEQLKALGYLE
jgi:hypothetical protein